MGKVWFDEFSNVGLNFDALTVLYPNITNAYFAKKRVVESSVLAADGTTTNIEQSIDFEEVDTLILGRQTYLIIEANSLFLYMGIDFNLQIFTADAGLTGTADEALNILQDGTATDTLTGTFGDTSVLDPEEGENPYNNLTDFEQKLIFKVDIRPDTRATFDTWSENIEAANNAPKLKLQISCSDSNVFMTANDELSTIGQTLDLLVDDGPGLENKKVYEIYHADNNFNPLDGDYTITSLDGSTLTGNKRIGRLENDQSEEATYFYHSALDNEYEVCSQTISSVRRRGNGRKYMVPVLDPQTGQPTFDANNNPIMTNSATAMPGFTSQEPAPGGSAVTNYHYASGRILTTGDYNARYYDLASNDANDLVELVRMPDNLAFSNDGIVIEYTFHNSQRRYCNPGGFASLIGVLAKCSLANVVCNGMCFGDATSYPSLSHPNGDSIDLRYFGRYNEDDRDQQIIDAFDEWGFSQIIRGNTQNWLEADSHNRHHNDHLHSGNFVDDIISVINE